MKLILKTGTELQVASAPSQITDTQIVIGFISINSIDELISQLTEASLAEFTLLQDENSVVIYTSYTKVLSPMNAYKAEDGTWEVAIKLEKPDENALKLRELQEKVALLETLIQ
jgi:hypothetical protein